MQRKRDEHGASAVEFALVLPFLCLVLFGMVTTGLTYSDHLAITNAVREGGRLGASLPFTPSPATTANWAQSVQERVASVYYNKSGSQAASNVCVKLVPKTGADIVSVGNNCGTEPPFDRSTMADGSCVVKVWIHKPADIELIVAPTLNFNIGAESVSYYGRVGGACTAS